MVICPPIVCLFVTRWLGKTNAGLDGHVCELQLILKSFHEIKSNEGHARFVAFRNKQAQ